MWAFLSNWVISEDHLLRCLSLSCRQLTLQLYTVILVKRGWVTVYIMSIETQMSNISPCSKSSKRVWTKDDKNNGWRMPCSTFPFVQHVEAARFESLLAPLWFFNCYLSQSVAVGFQVSVLAPNTSNRDLLQLCLVFFSEFICSFWCSSSSIWQLERSTGSWKNLNLVLSSWLEDAWRNNVSEVELEDRKVLC